MNTRPLLIRASAGTGKTYQLTGRLLRILLAGGAPETILATTFTRKAAGEILSRVLITLAQAATSEEDSALQALARQTGVDSLSRNDCLALSHQLLREMHRLKVLTIDSFFAQLARALGYEIGVPPGWRLADEVEDAWLRERVIDTLLGTIETSELMSLLAMLAKGDTKRSVRLEILNIINDGYEVARGCPPEVWTDLDVPAGPQEPQLLEAVALLRTADAGHKTTNRSLQGIADLVDSSDWDDLAEKSLVLRAFESAAGESFTHSRKAVPPDIVSALRVIAAACQSRHLGLLRAQTEATGRVIAHYDSLMAQTKHSLRVLSFADVTYRLATMFSNESLDRVGFRMDGAMDHVLLDEFQDTSPAQWHVIKPFALRAVRRSDKGSFFCVGDTKQAIYGWRGGVAAIFDAVSNQVPGIEQVEQNESYRSSPILMQTVNRLFRGLMNHPALGTANGPDADPASREAYEADAIARFATAFPEHRSAKGPMPGYVCIETSGADSAGEGEKRLGHLLFVADRIASLAVEFPTKSVGVLTRTNRTVAGLIHLLRQRQVDVSQEGGNPLTDSPAVELVLSALLMADHPGDHRWWFHVACSPLGPSLGLLDQGAAIGPWAQDREARIPSIEAAGSTIRSMVEQSGMARAVEELAGRLVAHCDSGDVLRLRQLVTLAQQYELNRQPRISDFVRLVREKRVEKPRPAQVRVMTVHQAKGLEFDLVVLPELDSPLVRAAKGLVALRDAPGDPPRAMLRFTAAKRWVYLPKRWQRALGEQAAGQMTEALCLLYVAVTRPRHALHLVIPPTATSKIDQRTPAALLYHALECTADPSEGRQVWFEAGDRGWCGGSAGMGNEPSV